MLESLNVTSVNFISEMDIMFMSLIQKLFDELGERE